ncbi:hypothetical protein ACIBL3_10490 [Kribbella sp. NPDC050124]|uniref:hypothetical protein n=1 Tax=Kribbella sp. NPDC050124 TaxID=3364114 RepID=UPI0037991384
MNDIRKLAAVGMIGAAVTAVSGAFVAAVVQPASDVSDQMWSYPWSSDLLVPISSVYAVVHLLVFVGMLGFARSVRGRAARVGSLLALVGTFVFFVAELATIPFADQRMDDTGPKIVGTAFGLGIALTAAGLITAGISVLRSSDWQGWRRYTPLGAGLWSLVMIGISATGALAAGVAVYGASLFLLYLAAYTQPTGPSVESPARLRARIDH